MRVQMAVVFAFLAATSALATEPLQLFAEAEAIWKAKRDDAMYQSYAAEFAQFNNYFHLDEKDGCYALGSGQVNLMLIITHPVKAEYAVVERVLLDVDKGAMLQEDL